MSYAAHQEAVATALHQLLRHPQPLEENAAEIVLACREQAIKAIRERLAYLAGAPEMDAVRPQATLTSLTRLPMHHLVGVLGTLPRPPVAQVPPSQLLTSPLSPRGRNRTAVTAAPVECWRQTARGLLLGTADLVRADHQPWTHQAAAGWHLVGDAATTLEALLVLDDRLIAAGHLPHGCAHAPDRDRIAQRLITAQAARLASWYGTDPAADLATSGIRHDLGVGGHPPVTLVRRPADFARAQRSLTALFRGQAELLRPGSDQLPGLTAARTLATGQIRLAQAFAGWADHAAQPELAEQFRTRIPALRDLHVSTVRLAEVEKRRSPLLLTQQSEMVIALRSPITAGADWLTAKDLRDLNRATHELTVTLGRALRHKAIGSHNIVALDAENVGLSTAQPMSSTEWAFTAACQHLADQPAPPLAADPPRAPRRRAQLRTTLDETGIGTPPPLRRMRPSLTHGPMPPGRHRDTGRHPSQ